jgi:phosphohistidine phosphatase
LKTLFLVRHATSNLDCGTFKDFERILSDQGKIEAKLMGKKIFDMKNIPEHIISSGAHRAISTACILSHELNYDKDQIEINNSIYNTSYDNILSIVKNTFNDYQKLMIVGHNPSLHISSQMLSSENIDIFPPASVCCIDFNIDDWNQILEGKMKYFFTPQTAHLICKL